ncbi:nuclear pore complex assembly-domain-containing protein [Podospora fimiseda]|uniref:Nuclear pore complex assembly-domain-containing protein n=1 Tax=Podospora fimiseda TaxID=252190 RepID=A0AAN7BYI5_9PEZI|nr:nuclear pore complex assembly-domain-containing protein [Podospora fimiseda]
MLDFTHFSTAFPSDGPKPYDPNGVRQIETFRKNFDGTLFIDRVLRALGINDGPKVYPPRTESSLRSLHSQIISSPGVSLHARLSVLYYLLLDYDEIRSPSLSNLALSLADESGLPKNYQILMRGLWHMDHNEFKFALEHLCHPSLPSEFADDIITVLVKHTTDDDYSLPLAYWHTVQPTLKTSEALELLFGALARTSVTEALYFTRTFGGDNYATRKRLFEMLVGSVVGSPDALGSRGKELVSLPFEREEEKWFGEYLSERGSGEGGRKGKNARAVVKMREVVTGRNREPVGVNRW